MAYSVSTGLRSHKGFKSFMCSFLFAVSHKELISHVMYRKTALCRMAFITIRSCLVNKIIFIVGIFDVLYKSFKKSHLHACAIHGQNYIK